MIEEAFDLVANDGLLLKGKSYLPEGDVKVLVCIVHGLGEHQGRYAYLAQKFCTSEIAVFTYDQRGHGLSEGKRGHASSHRQLLDDVEEILKKARAEFTDLPLVLMGHSLGGGVVANYALKRSSRELKAIILSSPWLRVAFPLPAWQLKLLPTIERFLPSFTIDNNLDAFLLTHQREEAIAFKEDPLSHTRISIRNFLQCYAAGFWALENASKLKVPALVLHGDDDKITDMTASKEFVQRAGGKATFHQWTGLRHEPHHEEEKDMVIDFLKEWILTKA